MRYNKPKEKALHIIHLLHICYKDAGIRRQDNGTGGFFKVFLRQGAEGTDTGVKRVEYSESRFAFESLLHNFHDEYRLASRIRFLSSLSRNVRCIDHVTCAESVTSKRYIYS